ncbi:MAG: hemolysin family protein [Candidatus Micrarchaeota archaeon]|nr:hemolysin family protein [Candidatus Micrarchaeota archaeon]
MDIMIDAIALASLIAISAFFSACETSFLTVTRIRLHQLVERGAPGAQSLHRLRESRRRVLIALLIGNNVATIAASAVATTLAITFFGDQGIGIAVGAMAFLILTFGDIMPKSFATNYGEKIILTCAPIVEGIYWAFTPLVVFFEFINRLIPGVYSRATGIERFTEEEVKAAVKLGAAHKSISEMERELIENVLEFNDKTVAHVMTPKARVVHFPAGTTATDALHKALHSLYYRFPVVKDGQVLGTVNIRALAKAVEDNPNWRVDQVVLPTVRVKSTDRLNDAFNHLQAANRHFSIVVDEKENFVGVLTMDDMLEELVGKIKIQ